MARRRAMVSPGGTTKPVRPCSTMPRRPSVSETTTGLAMAMASSSEVMPKGYAVGSTRHDHDRGPVVLLAQLEMAERSALDPLGPGLRARRWARGEWALLSVTNRRAVPATASTSVW